MSDSGGGQPAAPAGVERLTAGELGAWQQIHGRRRQEVPVLTDDEQREFEPLRLAIRRATRAGFAPYAWVRDRREHRHGYEDESRAVVTRTNAGRVEVIVFLDHELAQAYRVDPGAPVLDRPAELEDAPGALVELVLSRAWDAQPWMPGEGSQWVVHERSPGCSP